MQLCVHVIVHNVQGVSSIVLLGDMLGYKLHVYILGDVMFHHVGIVLFTLYVLLNTDVTIC